MIYLLLFWKPIRVSSGAMHSCIFLSLINVSLGRSSIFGLAIASAALLRVGRWGGFSPHIFPGVFITVFYMPYFGFVYFLQGDFSTHWTFGKILRTFLRSWGFPFPFNLSSIFRRRLQKYRQFFLAVSVQDGLFFPPNLLMVSTLVDGFLIFWPLVWKFFLGLLLIP